MTTLDEVSQGFWSGHEGISAYRNWALTLLQETYGKGPYTEEQLEAWVKLTRE